MKNEKQIIITDLEKLYAVELQGFCAASYYDNKLSITILELTAEEQKEVYDFIRATYEKKKAIWETNKKKKIFNLEQRLKKLI